MTPQGQLPPNQPGWFSRNWKWLIALAVLVPMLCCGSLIALGGLAALFGSEPDAVQVDCGTPGPEGVDCDLKRTAGVTTFEACWDLEITCANQAVMVGHACSKVPAGQQTGKANMLVSAFSNQDKCDAPKAGVVTNLVVTPD